MFLNTKSIFREDMLAVRKSVSCTHMLLAFTSCGAGFAPNLNATLPPVIPLVIPPRSIHSTGSVINSTAWARDGGNVTTGDDGGYVRTWDVLTGEAWRTLSGHSSYVFSVAYSPDGKHLASGSDDETVKIWDTATGQCTRTLSGHTDWLNLVAYSPDGTHLASGNGDETVQIDSV